jgi:hypothetical protein
MNGKSQPLGRFSTIAFLSAATAFLAQNNVQEILNGFTKKQPLPHTEMVFAAYAAVFLTTFLICSFLARHVSVSFTARAKGLERSRGFIPKLARLILISFIFAAPLSLLLGHQGTTDKTSLQTLISESEKKAKEEIGQGYNKEDRQKLGRILQTEGGQ